MDTEKDKEDKQKEEEKPEEKKMPLIEETISFGKFVERIVKAPKPKKEDKEKEE